MSLLKLCAMTGRIDRMFAVGNIERAECSDLQRRIASVDPPASLHQSWSRPTLSLLTLPRVHAQPRGGDTTDQMVRHASQKCSLAARSLSLCLLLHTMTLLHLELVPYGRRSSL